MLPLLNLDLSLSEQNGGIFHSVEVEQLFQIGPGLAPDNYLMYL